MLALTDQQPVQQELDRQPAVADKTPDQWFPYENIILSGTSQATPGWRELQTCSVGICSDHFCNKNFEPL